jgi:hypothetical protein
VAEEEVRVKVKAKYAECDTGEGEQHIEPLFQLMGEVQV